jgi:bacteriochlorophyll 4-vinyl reductase
VNAASALPDSAFPNKISRILLLAVKDVLGASGSNAVLTTARLAHLIEEPPPPDFESGMTFAQVGRLFEALEGIYGVQGANRLARRAGQESFKYWVEGFGGVLGIADVVLRVLPLSLRARIGLETLAEVFNRYSGQRVVLGENSRSYFLTLERCGFCVGRHTETPACAFPAGVLDETLFWVSRGRRFSVEEAACIACGDPVCTLCVGKAPLGSTEG